MPAPGAGGVQTSLVGTVQSMMASARAAFRRKPPPEQRRGAPVQSPGGDKNNPADLSQFAEDFEPSGGLFERGRPYRLPRGAQRCDRNGVVGASFRPETPRRTGCCGTRRRPITFCAMMTFLATKIAL